MKLDLFSLKKTFSSNCRKLNWCLAIYILWVSFPSLFAQSILMDFAQTTTTSPDVNGNYWNNYSSNGALNLVTSQGNSTTSYFTPNLGGGFNTNFITGSPNLPALGVFNIPTVYSDAINTTTNCSYYFYNINQNLTYDFSLFGSRDSTTTRTTQYTIEGSNTGSGSVTTSGVGVGGTGTNYNTANLVNITGITSTNYGGSIGNGVKITIAATSGGFGYLNAMSMNGYIGYLNGGTTTLNGAPAAGYVANGTYAGTSNTRSVDTVIGGGSTVNVNSGDGIYYNSTLIMTNGGGSVNVGTNFQAYALAGAGNLALGGANKLSLNHTGTYSGTITLNGAAMSLGAANAIGTGNLVLKGGSIDVGNASALGTGSISVNTNTTTINNTGLLNSLTGNNAFNLTGGGTLQVNGYGKTLNLGTGNVAVSGFNNLNGWSGGMQFDGVISGSGTINWYGGGTLALGGANTFSGTVTASGNNGTLSLLNVDALKNATLNKGANHNVSFGLVGNNTYNLASLTGAGDINLGGNTLNITNGGTYSGNLNGAGGVTVSGGILTLSTSSSYTGATLISQGTLSVGTSLQSDNVTVASGGLLLMPMGSILPGSLNFAGTSARFGISNLGVLSGSVTVLTAGSILGTPALDPEIPGYTLSNKGTNLVLEPSAQPVITSASSITYSYGSPFSYQIATSGSATSYSAVGLPPGLTLDTATGLITGTLSAPTNTVVQISAINAAGTSTINLVIDVTGQELLVDFGVNPTTNAVSGKTWNNWTNGGQVLSNMVDSAGVSTGYRLGFETDVAWGSNFGVAPSAGLGVFAESSVVNDGLFIVSTNTNGTTLSLTGLNPKSAYTFQLFGSRDAVETRATLYTLTGSNTVTGILTNSGSAQASAWGGVNYNPTNLLVASNLVPTRDGKISIKFQTAQGGFGYLNALRFTTTNYPAAASTYLSLANRWTDQNSIQAEPNGAVLFLGSSSIRRWESLTRDFADYQVIQRGMGGAVFSDIHQLLEDVAVVHNPRAVVLWAGVNDLYAYQSADYVMEQFTQFVATFTNRLPSTKLFYLGIPRNPEFAGTPTRNAERISVNTRIAGFIATNNNPNLHFVDLPAAFDGLQDTSVTTTTDPAFLWAYQVDSAHPNQAAYTIWRGLIRNALVAHGILPDRLPVSNPLAPAAGQRILFDFGPADAVNGDATLVADERGHVWNNWHAIQGAQTVVAGEKKSDLVDSFGNPTGLTLTITGDFQASGKQNGGLTSLPSLGLGHLATLTAAQDYFFSTGDALSGGGSDNVPGGFRISGLNPGLTYDLKFLASRSVSGTRQTRYEVYGVSSNSVTLRSSGAGIGVNRGDGNDQTLASVTSVRPNAYGDIFVDVSALSQASSGDVVAYLNAMELSVVSTYEAWARSKGLVAGVDHVLSGANLEQFALDGSTVDAVGNQAKIRGMTTSSPGAQALNLAMPVRKGTSFAGSTSLTGSQDGVTYEVLGSGDLINWNLPVELVSSSDTTGLPSLADPSGYEYRRFRIKDLAGTMTKGFLKSVIRSSGGSNVPAVAGKTSVSAASYSSMHGVQVSGGTVAFFDGGDWIKYGGVDFGNGATSVTFSASKVGSGGAVEIRVGSPTGRLIGNFNPQDTGGWSAYREQLVQLSGFVSGVQDLYLVATGGAGVCNLESFRFSQYMLTWADEFNGSSLNTNNWTATFNGDVANGELQFYTDRANNVSVANGVLQLTAIRENYTGQGPWMSAPKTTAYTSGLVESLNKVQPQYGKIEASMKIPRGAGLWPAFWMMGANYFTPGVGWPKCGEIDIMEYSGASGGFTAAFHTGSYNYTNSGGGITNTQEFSLSDYDTAFHIYGIEWTPTRVAFYLDGKVLLTADKSKMGSSQDQWPFDQPYWIKLNLAVGGSYGGDPTSGTFPKTMEVDWVRVYEDQDQN